MQIFAADEDPRAAADHVRHPKHRHKILLEAVQLLYAAHHRHGTPLPPAAYRATHLNHPCAVWAAASAGNYAWLAAHAGRLLENFVAWRAERHAERVAAAAGTRRTVKPPGTPACAAHVAWLAAHPIPGPAARTPFALAIAEAELPRVRVDGPAGIDVCATYRAYAATADERIRRHAAERELARALKAARPPKAASALGRRSVAAK